jgi:DNA-binding response OmpR family regulator
MDDPQHLRPALAGQLVILVAEDEVMICNIVRIALEEMGFFVLTASDGEQALELSRNFRGTIHALVSDIVMPNLDGLGLCEQIRRERPEIKVLLLSGTAGPLEGVSFLRKPFGVEEIQEKMRQLVGGITSTQSASRS